MITSDTVQSQGNIAIKPATGQWRVVWHAFRRNRVGMFGLVTLSLMVLAVIFVPIFWPDPYNRINPDGTLWGAPMGTVDPSNGHLFVLGSDKVGRDNLSLVFQAGRLSLAIAFIPTVFVLVLGFAIGALAGYLGGWVDSLLMRVADFLLALPLIPAYLIALRLIRSNPRDAGRAYDSFALWETMGSLIIVFIIFGWMGVSRLVRGMVLSLRSQPFVEAAQALGASNTRIMFRHLLPNTAAPLLVAGMFAVGDFIILEAVLSYFGLGIPDTINPTVVSWGNMLAASQDQAWFLTNLNPFEQIRGYLVIFPSILLFITVLSINFIGDALREVLDPRLHR